ncbi:G domain-containing protein [Vibrio crassostreae]|uniref:GTPase family protein n=1 Tax=Vibrio crassostreae TaxID=246167 RepID=UPI001B300FD8|nr:GTPase [Vibrio crassostreae]CAK1743914.1 G domain-containing protein [Vibrio crassostreae]CAK1762444.1 G domain-containing protein [Vibrio crassostreae]CAK1762562.1 G domain-containing protein [Vibrio crassostreae]CAK1762647.1 G domain-containing protein [Vibrio crassostreae]CAK1764064.1 G domain-containing protein [Vibrio crassostreae]
MKKIRNLFRLLAVLSSGRWGIALISAIFPSIIMMGFGVFLAIKYGYLLEMSIAIAVSTLVFTIPLFISSRSSRKPTYSNASANPASEGETEPPSKSAGINDVLVNDTMVKASDEWSQAELLIWNDSKHYVRQQLSDEIEWGNLDQTGLEVLEFVAKKFDKKSLDFSIPEGLKLFEEVSRRYKLVVKEHIPGIEYLKVSYIKAGYEAYDKYGELGQKIFKAAIWGNHLKNLYLNPLKVISDLGREQATASMTRGVVDDMQYAAKQALLDEVAAVAIDLYSGRFSIEDEALRASDVSETDEKRFAPELEPVRIVLVGQTSSGKSSLINALKQELVAEVDVLPSTDTSTVYNAFVDDNDVRVVDLQGLDGNPKTEALMLKEMTQADVVLWVLKANQSARELDKQLKDRFDAFYDDPKNISRKKPIVVSVVNQVDRLKPVDEWKPPYDLENPTSAKATIIAQALEYNQTLLQPDIALPLAIAPEKVQFGLDTLRQTLIERIADANNVQRNRQRLEAMKRGTSVKGQLNKAVNAGKKVAPSALKAATPKLAEMAIKQVVKKK